MWGIVATVVIFAGIALAVWLSSAERRFDRELAAREPLDDAAFYEKFYVGANLPREVVVGVRQAYAEHCGYDPTKLRPQDRPPSVEDLDTVELAFELETRFAITFADQDCAQCDGTLDALIRLVANTRATSSG